MDYCNALEYHELLLPFSYVYDRTSKLGCKHGKEKGFSITLIS